ncbi:MAG: hypothetical protein J5710_13505 [Treponema sp.]|nr:hypothetical protein [Treponema sp.]
MSIIIVLLIVCILIIFFKKKNNKSVIISKNSNSEKVVRHNDNQNFLGEESKIQNESNFEEQDKLTDALLVKQEKQFKVLEKAKKEIENGNLEEGISIIEDITYNKGGIIFPGVSWPMYLAEVLYKNKMYDRCWKYLNHISLTHLDCFPKIKNLQSKICTKEKKYKDALFFSVMSVVYTYQNSSFIPTLEVIKIKMDKKTKVKINISEDELYQKILNYINEKKSEIEVRDDLSKIIV